MLKVAKDDVRDGEQEYNNAVILSEELKASEKENKNSKCECEARVRAYMRMLRVGEGTEGEIGYTKLFGGKDFTKSPHNKDMSDHPQIKVYWYTKKDGTKIHSSASGAYQVMGYTWSSNNMKIQRKVYCIKDFKQESQDLFCIILFKHKRKGMLKMIVEGKIEEATEKYGSYEWASLPPGRYGQPNKTMKKALELYDKFLKEELAEKSDLHLKKGFLKKFGVSCKCGKKVKKGEVCSDCKKEHIDLRDDTKWISQFTLERPNVACYRACVKIAEKFNATVIGLGKESKDEYSNNTSKWSGVIQIFTQNNTSGILNKTKDYQKGIDYLNSELENNNPVVVGLDDGRKSTYNKDNSTEHFIILIGRGCENGDTYYNYYEVGTRHKDKGTKDSNKLSIKSTGEISGTSPGGTKTYKIVQIRKNKS